MKRWTSFEMPEEFVRNFGEEWRGKVAIHILNAKEYLDIAQTVRLQEKMRMQENANYKPLDTDGITMEIQRQVVIKATTINDKSIADPDEFPAKLYEFFACHVLPLNVLSVDESQRLFRGVPE